MRSATLPGERDSFSGSGSAARAKGVPPAKSNEAAVRWNNRETGFVVFIEGNVCLS